MEIFHLAPELQMEADQEQPAFRRAGQVLTRLQMGVLGELAVTVAPELNLEVELV